MISTDSTIMSVGRFPNPKRLGWIIAAIVALFTCVVFLGLWAGFRPRIFIPKNTAILLSVMPRTVHQGLTFEQEQSLPLIWQNALRGDSRWPVVLGAYHHADQWHFFALVPRWRARGMMARDRRGLIALISDEALPQGERELGYLDQASWWQSVPGASFAFWMDPRAFLSGEIANQRLEPFVGYFKRRAIYTNIEFQSFGTAPLKQVDISFHFPQGSAARSLANTFLDALGLSDLPLKTANLDPIQLSVAYDDEHSPSDVILRFNRKIEKEQARQIFGFLGLTKRIVSKLEDGTLVQEQVLPVEEDSLAYIGQRTSPSHGVIEIVDNELMFGKNAKTMKNALNSVNSCPGIHANARLSTQALSFFISNFASSSTILLPPIQIGSLDNRLAFCFE